jgi:hypothetical protein
MTRSHATRHGVSGKMMYLHAGSAVVAPTGPAPVSPIMGAVGCVPCRVRLIYECAFHTRGGDTVPRGGAEGRDTVRVGGGPEGHEIRECVSEGGRMDQGVSSACGSGACVYMFIPTAAGMMRDPRRSLDTNPA